MRKIFKVGAISLACLMVFGVAGCSCNRDDKEQEEKIELPEARKSTCTTDDYSANCSNISADNFDTYAERDDVMYIDLRNANDYIQSHLHGFEMIEFFASIYGDGTQLFDNASDNMYMPRYTTSVDILEDIVPKDQVIFFMCASGGRVVHMMKIMEMNGWDMSKIYNIGGMSTYGESKYRIDGYDVSDLTVASTPVTTSTNTSTEKYIEDLPNARKESCDATDYSVACSTITNANFNDYAKRKDILYVDLRNATDYIQSHLHGFEMIEFFNSIYGNGTQLFDSTEANRYVARYSTSVEILEDMLPKDKTIFFICASGGRVVHMMKIMEKYGWNMNNVYNIGGMSTYGESKYRVDGYDVNDLTGITLHTGTFTQTSFEHEYITTAKVAVDSDGKITHLYVSGECSSSEDWEDNSKWLNGKYDFIESLKGKTLQQINTILGDSDTASGSDVVTGATLSSNRVYKAIVNALAE